MTCCNPKLSHNKQMHCPVDGNLYKAVSSQTITHHIKSPWLWDDKGRQYYYCDSKNCDVVYFSEDGALVQAQDIKDTKQQLCYCFGVSHNDFKKTPSIKQYVIQQTKTNHCSCKTSNPSGRCCLKDFKAN